jgi:hypothetical protein
MAPPSSEVPRAVAVDALTFLEVLLNVTSRSDVGISKIGAEMVGEAVTLIMATTLFADSPQASEVASLAAATRQCIKVVELLSASELTGFADFGKKTTSGARSFKTLIIMVCLWVMTVPSC